MRRIAVSSGLFWARTAPTDNTRPRMAATVIVARLTRLSRILKSIFILVLRCEVIEALSDLRAPLDRLRYFGSKGISTSAYRPGVAEGTAAAMRSDVAEHGTTWCCPSGGGGRAVVKENEYRLGLQQRAV